MEEDQISMPESPFLADADLKPFSSRRDDSLVSDTKLGILDGECSMKANYDEDDVYDEDFEVYDDEFDINDTETKGSNPQIDKSPFEASIFEATMKLPADENTDSVLIDDKDATSTIETDQEIDVITS